ncbi:MAG: sugar phosphate nucleotidyltransferase [Nitrospirae bacterium]|nr:sugar phosphate nucleotidyltransferase [Nitrospirota bacterium]MCL5979069.1 sugar phosphate nucleotidyltransferase [Nitrospirota bacterium]
MTKNINAFLPAAGLGERLRPITYHTPKPLLPILGKPLIKTIIEKFSLISSGKIGINLHYKADMLREWGRNSAFSGRIEFFYEDPILGTGGALKNAERFLSNGHFLVHNSDIVSNIDCSRLIETHLSEGNIATLATHDYPKYNNVVLDDKGYVIDVENAGTSMPDPETAGRKTAYTGIAVYSPEILKFLPEGVSHATVAWLAAAKAGHKVKALDFTGCYWNDIGTPSAYALAVVDALRVDGETIYIHENSSGCSNAEMDGYIAIEKGCVLDKESSLRNCIVLEGGRVESKRYENCIIGHDFEIPLSEAEMLGVDKDAGEDNKLILIGTGGSDRKYYRMRKNGSTAVLVKYKKDDPDFLRHIEYTKFFMKHNIPVPELSEVDAENMAAIFEDLGDLSLYSRLKCKGGEEQTEGMYRKALDIVVHIHTITMDSLNECPLLQKRIFDYEHFRWESEYFIDRFVKGIKGMDVKYNAILQKELNSLASKADSFPKTIMHRDFQSQNIMIKNGLPRLIDYQGARIGPSAYDIASMLWDPYHRLDDTMRERLVHYYIDKIKEIQSAEFIADEFMESLAICRLQRHMQALGAYGFLSTEKGKKYFLKHIPEALRLLKEDILPLKSEYPALYELIDNCKTGMT